MVVWNGRSQSWKSLSICYVRCHANCNVKTPYVGHSQHTQHSPLPHQLKGLTLSAGKSGSLFFFMTGTQNTLHKKVVSWQLFILIVVIFLWQNCPDIMFLSGKARSLIFLNTRKCQALKPNNDKIWAHFYQALIIYGLKEVRIRITILPVGKLRHR